MSRLRLILAEAVRSLGANLSTTFAATTTVLIGMFMLGLVIGLGSWALSLSHHYKKQLLAKVYFCTTAGGRCSKDATAKEMNNVRAQLLAIPQVRSVRFVSKADALRHMEKTRPDLTKNLPGNPLPNGYDVIPKRGDDIDAITRRLEPLTTGVMSICPPAPGTPAAETPSGETCGRITHRVLSVANYLWIVVLIAFVVLLVSSTLLVANTIRLSIFARRREIEVMKLVGATNWFVRGPFVLEGLLCGLIGSIAAVFLLVCSAFVHWYEEPTLARQFGARYDEYRRAVPGWWPRRRPWQG